MNEALRLLGLKNTSCAGLGEKVSYPHCTNISCPDAENPSEKTVLLNAYDSLESSRVPSDGSHVLSVFLFNSSLHVAKNFNKIYPIIILIPLLDFYSEAGQSSLFIFLSSHICNPTLKSFLLLLQNYKYISFYCKRDLKFKVKTEK